MRKFLLLFNLLVIVLPAWSQFGEQSFNSMLLPANAQEAAIGGTNISSLPASPSAIFQNPAWNDTTGNTLISLNFNPFLGDINYYGLANTFNAPKIGSISWGLRYFDYGTVDAYDPTGASIGQVHANDFALSVAKSHSLGLFQLGASLSWAFSNVATYKANALLMDFGGQFNHPTQDLQVGLVLKNIGLVLSDYNDASMSVPFDLQAGVSFKPEHMPIKFSLTGYSLQRGDISGYDPNIDPADEAPGVVDKIFQHLIIGTEIYFGKHFHVLAGYNQGRRSQLKLEEASGGAGFSLGFDLNIKYFAFAYSHAFYNVSSGSNHLSLTLDLNSFTHKNIW